MKKLREITNEEKLNFYWNIGDRPENYTHVNSDGTERQYTREEWEDVILEFRKHPDLYDKDLSYIGKRREQYPDEVEQIDSIWKILSYMRDNGVDLGPEGDMLDTILSVKASIPKPSGL
ncbi:hypothetical protein R1080702_110 [Cyanophage S-RIM32]|uniref:Uncharacterized protein n=1 Tax=Cyanophage S-RIM32 TaxID=1278479 RepID=A0A127KME4_9CAUD|nr:hypothetical protein BJD26_gp146 [Cyanophage S-RIM32]AMO43119.1 hypothetical protein R1080702_110 [Cyanophage S-RIM32]